METKTSGNKKDSVSSTLARSDDGTIQITFTVAYHIIEKVQDEAIGQLSKEIEIPGFRKGFAPPEKIKEHVSQNTLIEKTLSGILPKLVTEVIEKYKIKPAIYPRFELLKAQVGEDWQIRAITCEIPEIQLGDYKTKIAGEVRAKNIWTPASAKDTAGNPQLNLTREEREEKEQSVIKALISSINVTIPKILIDEEVNLRLSKLLEKLEKLGLSIDSYLSSIGKTVQDVRKDYEKQAKDAISVELILSKIAQEENIQIQANEIDASIAASQADKKLYNELNSPERRGFIEVILKRRKSLDLLMSLI